MMSTDCLSRERQRFLDDCTQCGICASKCPVVGETGLIDFTPREIQRDVYNYLEKGELHDSVSIRAFSCMECYKCTVDDCPQGLNPLLINEIIKGEYKAREGKRESEEADVFKTHKILASLQTSGEEYQRIMTPRKAKGKYLFFPGCNVYQQPEEILNTLDILDLLGCDYSYLPGLENCCGDRGFYGGDPELGLSLAGDFMEKVKDYDPETILFWCPTCHCRFSHYLPRNGLGQRKLMSVHEYILDNMDRLSYTEKVGKVKVTLHEACKSSYTGVDGDAPRQILNKIPGIEIAEMEHHGKNTRCCGSGAVGWYPRVFDKLLDSRLKEADETEADRLVSVCHFCELSFVQWEEKHPFAVTNIINLLAESVGIVRENKLRDYLLSGSIDGLALREKWETGDRAYSYDDVVKAIDSLKK